MLTDLHPAGPLTWSSDEDTQTATVPPHPMGQETARRAHRAVQGYKHADGPRGPDSALAVAAGSAGTPPSPSRVPVVQVELQGSCDESFHRVHVRVGSRLACGTWAWS